MLRHRIKEQDVPYITACVELPCLSALARVLLPFVACLLLVGCGSSSGHRPVISFTSIPEHTFGDPPFEVSATSTSAAPIVYQVLSGPAAIFENTVTLLGAGSIVLSASQIAGDPYLSSQTETIIQVNRATPILAFSLIPSQPYGEPPFSVFAASASSTSVAYTIISGPATLSGNMVTVKGVGAVVLQASQEASVNYLSAQTTASFSVTPGVPSLSLSAIPSHCFGDLPFAVTSSSSSKAPTSYSVLSGPAMIDGGTVTLTDVGRVVVQASQSATTDYGAATATGSFLVEEESIVITPGTVAGGEIAITIQGHGFTPSSQVLLGDSALSTHFLSDTTLQATGFLAPWKSGSTSISVLPFPAGAAVAQRSLPITPTAVSFDVVARFSTQAAFGPIPGLVQHIQQIGLEPFIHEQMAEPVSTYDPTVGAREQYLKLATAGPAPLRMRVAWALQSFLVGQAIFREESGIPLELTLERNAFGNFRTLMTDVAGDPSIATLLDETHSVRSTNASSHPNQNFAREFLQLFTIGNFLLKDDGSYQLDPEGNFLPAYDQSTVDDLSRVFTGWTYAKPINPAYTFYGIDYTQPLINTVWQHDSAAKTLFGNVKIPSGLNPTEDRDAALDAVFNHPNLAPFIAHLLIQRMVTSNPSPQFIERVSKVFEDDGTGIRGNLGAVVQALLLDPEARSGDSLPAADDGFLQEPLLFEAAAIGLGGMTITDSQADDVPAELGEPFWFAPTVFGFVNPQYRIPGTSVTSPEFGLYNNASLIQRSLYLWGMIHGTTAVYVNPKAWIFTQFPTVPLLVDALNHFAYHGTMSQTQQSAIIDYCAGMDSSDPEEQLRVALFLALNGSGYVVWH